MSGEGIISDASQSPVQAGMAKASQVTAQLQAKRTCGQSEVEARQYEG